MKTKREEELEERLRTVRTAFADYVRSEGCSCCQQKEEHDSAARLLGGLLEVPLYSDGSGHDFYKFCSDEEFVKRMEAV